MKVVLGLSGGVAAIVVLLVVLSGVWGVEHPDEVETTVRGRSRDRNDRSAIAEHHGYLAFEIKIERADGRPAVDASVSYDGPSHGSVVTGPSGVAHVDGLARGYYSLRARKRGETGTLRFRLDETTHLGTLRLTGVAEVRGHVLDPSGQPIAGALVEAIAAETAVAADMTALVRAMGAPEAVAARTTSGPDGSWALDVAAEARVALRASATGHAVDRRPARRFGIGETVDFHLRPGADLAGHVVDDAGRPIAGARVMVVEPARLAEGVPKIEATSDRDGSFALTAPPMPSPVIVVRAPGFAPTFRSDVRMPATDLRIELERGLTVSLRVVDAADPDGPLPGISVVIDLEGGFATGSTDGAGRLTLRNLPARRDPAARGDHVILWGAGFAAAVIPITVEIPATGDLDLGDLPLDAGGTVRGRVLEEGSGRPVRGAVVRSIGGLPGAIALAAAPTAVSGADGSFLLEGVPLAARDVLAIHPDYEAPEGLERMLSAETAPGRSLFSDGGRATRRDVLLRPAGSLRGRVVDDRNRPVAGAVVRAGDGSVAIAAGLGGAVPETTSDAEGRFTLGGLPRDRPVPIAATHPEAGESAPIFVSVGGRDEVVLTLTPGATVRGTVLNEEARPVPGVSVTAIAPDRVRTALTNAQGVFVLSGVAPGPVPIRLDHPGFVPVERIERIDGDEIEIGPTTLPDGAVILGLVVDEGGEPVAGVEILASSRRPGTGEGRDWGRARSENDGGFAIRGLAPGSYALEARAGGTFVENRVVETDGDGVRLVARPAAVLRGRIVTGEIPVAGAGIEVGVEGQSVGRATSREDGGFVVDALPPGRPVDLVVRHDGFEEARRTGVEPRGDTIEIGLEPGRQVGGRVLFEDGTPVVGALVEALAGSSAAGTARTDATGRFLIGGLPEGELGVRVLESGQGLTVSDPFPAAAGFLETRVTAVRGETITGTVRAPDGSPASRVRVTAVDDEGRIVASAWVGRPGDGFALRGLRPGSYTIRAERDARPAVEAARAEALGVAGGSRSLELRLEAR